jgi:hypothetical protein
MNTHLKLSLLAMISAGSVIAGCASAPPPPPPTPPTQMHLQSLHSPGQQPNAGEMEFTFEPKDDADKTKSEPTPAMHAPLRAAKENGGVHVHRN